MGERIKKIWWRSSGQDGGTGRNPSLPCTTKRRITTNLKSINNHECQKNQTAWNSNSQEIKEKVNQNNQTGKTPWWGSGPRGWSGLKAKLRLRADCGLQQGLLQWEKLPVSQEFIGKWAGAEQASCTVPSLAPPHRQCCSAARRVALPWWIPKAPPPYNLTGVPRQRFMA